MQNYYVYILTTKNNKVLYVGVTNSLARRLSEHRLRISKGFTTQYGVVKLIYYEVFNDPLSAIEREKQLKNWERSWKLDLIMKANPDFKEIKIDSGSSPE